MSFAESPVGRGFLERGLKFLLRNPERNLPLIINTVDKFIEEEHHKRASKMVKEFLNDKDSHWYRYTMDLLNNTHPHMRDKIAVNFLIRGTLCGVPKQHRIAEELGVSVPWAVLIDPTERCNLNCKGCWAGSYEQVNELDFDVMDRVLTECEELGIYFVVVSGGEPEVRKDALIELAERHPSQVFHVYTNGTLIDEHLVKEMKRLGNIVLALSIDGLEETSDERRGPGVFRRVMEGMDLLRENNCLFGASVTYCRDNVEEVGSDKFVDLLVDKGVSFAWYFTYVPIGRDVDLEYMATPEQRAYMKECIEYFRANKPIFIADFWNDGEAVNGCIAGGRRYFHINAAGEVEPCAFIHYSTCNIYDVSVREALQNPLFKAYQKRQPFNTNMMCPCPLIDNPEMLRDIVHESGARSTQARTDCGPDELAERLKVYASEWGGLADSIMKRKKSRTGRTEYKSCCFDRGYNSGAGKANEQR